MICLYLFLYVSFVAMKNDVRTSRKSNRKKNRRKCFGCDDKIQLRVAFIENTKTRKQRCKYFIMRAIDDVCVSHRTYATRVICYSAIGPLLYPISIVRCTLKSEKSLFSRFTFGSRSRSHSCNDWMLSLVYSLTRTVSLYVYCSG